MIKEEKLLGSNKVIVGKSTSDLVLETLGKVYIKSGKNMKLLNNLFKLIDSTPENVCKTISTEAELQSITFPGDGVFVFAIDTKTLYIAYNKSYIKLGEEITSEGYVKRSGDIMSGQLTINTKDAPLVVTSNTLVKNLNAEYLNGYKSDVFTKRNTNENINGNWTFHGNNTVTGDWTFKNPLVKYSGSLVSTGGFASGFSGYGWKLDSATNTLTIDNLIVRKAMNVYELVVNKIRATNGSIWVSDGAKIEKVTKLVDSLTSGSISVTLPKTDHSSNITTNTTYTSVRYNYNNEEIYENISNYDNDLTLFPFFNTKQEYWNINNSTINNTQTDYLYWDLFLGDFYEIILDDENVKYCPFRTGDLLRCQKYTNNLVKYYDAIVTNVLIDKIIIRLSSIINDKYETELPSESTYSSSNLTINKLSDPNRQPDSPEVLYSTQHILAQPQEKDSLVRIGNIFNTNRQGSIYITSSDDQAPYIDILDQVVRPDYNINRYIYNSTTTTGDWFKSNKTRLGKLNGIYDPAFDSQDQPTGYGLYSENVYLTGRLIVKNNINSAGYILGEYRGEWVINTQYYLHDTVTYNGSTYTALQGHISTSENTPDNASYWKLYIKKGDEGTQGKTGPSLSYRGNYDSVKTYTINNNNRNVIKYNTTYYMSFITEEHTSAMDQFLTESNGVYTINAGSMSAGIGSVWITFQGNFESVATNLLLAENASFNIANTNTLYIGDYNSGTSGWLLNGYGFSTANYIEGASGASYTFSDGISKYVFANSGSKYFLNVNSNTPTSQALISTPAFSLYKDKAFFRGDIYSTISGEYITADDLVALISYMSVVDKVSPTRFPNYSGLEKVIKPHLQFSKLSSEVLIIPSTIPINSAVQSNEVAIYVGEGGFSSTSGGSSGGTDDHNLLANRFSDSLSHIGYQHDISVIDGLQTALDSKVETTTLSDYLTISSAITTYLSKADAITTYHPLYGAIDKKLAVSYLEFPTNSVIPTPQTNSVALYIGNGGFTSTSGGSGGTDNYNDLANKPTINNNEIRDITISDGTNISINTEYNATTKATTLTINNNYSYNLPVANATTLGGIKVGSNLSIDANGTLNSDAYSKNEIDTIISTTNNAIASNYVTLNTDQVISGVKGYRLSSRLSTSYNCYGFVNDSATVTGILCINLPHCKYSHTSLTYKIKLYQWGSGYTKKTSEVIVSFYVRPDSTTGFGAEHTYYTNGYFDGTVALGYNSTTNTNCIMLGNISSIWGYIICSIEVSSSWLSIDDWLSGYSHTFITDTSDYNIRSITKAPWYFGDINSTGAFSGTSATLSTTLEVTGATTLGRTLDVIGDTTLGRNLSVSGNTYLYNNLKSIAGATFTSLVANYTIYTTKCCANYLVLSKSPGTSLSIDNNFVGIYIGESGFDSVSGGSGGTDNYNLLANKPYINGVQISSLNADSPGQNYISTLYSSDGSSSLAMTSIAQIDNTGKVLASMLPDYLLGQVLYGGNINGSSIATLTQKFKSKYGISTNTLTITSSNASTYEGVYFISTADAVSGIVYNLGVKTGDWVLSNGVNWTKVDNTDAVTGVKGDAENDYRIGNVNITYSNLGVNSVAYGGTGLSTISTGKLLIGNGANAITTNNNIYVANSILHSDLGIYTKYINLPVSPDNIPLPNSDTIVLYTGSGGFTSVSGGSGGTDNYNDLSNKPTINTYDIKDITIVGGTDVTVDTEYNTTTKVTTLTINNNYGYTLPIASATALGGIKVGSNLNINNGVLSGNAGTVTSVALSVPTGLTVTNSPITTSGTLAVAFASGYSIPTTANQDNWTDGYSHSQIINGANPHGTTFANIANKPTTISGYGITNAYTKTEIDSTVSTINTNISSNTTNISTIQGYFLNGIAKEASKITNSLVLKFNGGAVENTSLYTFNGSAAKTINIVSGNKIGFTIAAGSITINHSSITAPTLDNNKVINGITVDTYGHTTAITGLSYSASATANTLPLRGESGELRNTYLVLPTGQIPNGVGVGEVALYIGSGGFDSISGGSGGVSTWSELANKPKYNSTTNIPDNAYLDDRYFKDGSYTFSGDSGSMNMYIGRGLYFVGDNCISTSIDEQSESLGISHSTAPGYKHIPSGGSAGQILKYSSDGTAVWSSEYSYTLPLATTNSLGGIKIGYSSSGKNYAVQLSSGKAFVNVPWTDTTYSAGTGISLSGTVINNSGVRSIATGTANGTISVNTNGTTANVSVYGLGSNAYTSTAYVPTTRTIAGLALSADVGVSSLQSALGLGSNAYSSTAYLPLTGGIVENGNICINTSAGTYGLQLWDEDNNVSALLTSVNNVLKWNSNNILHAGNYTSYAVPTTRTIAGLALSANIGVSSLQSALGLGTAAYTASTSYAAASHTHSYLPLSGGTMTGTIQWSNSFNDWTANYEGLVILRLNTATGQKGYWVGLSVKNYYGFQLASYGGNNNTLQYRSTGVGTTGPFADWVTILHSSNYTSYAVPTTRTIAGLALSADVGVSSLQNALGLGSNAYTSTAYLPLTGGTLTGAVTGTTMSLTGIDLLVAGTRCVSYYGPATNGYLTQMQTTSTAGYGTHGAVTGDWALYNKFSGTTNRGWIWQLASVNVASISGTGAATFNGNVTAPTFSGALSGNATTATKLQTSRTIAGVSFDGSANISIPFANLSSKPTTISGYGITDALTTGNYKSILNPTYVNKTGDTMTGNLSIIETKNILLRPNNTNYYSGIGYDTSGDECIALWAKNTATRLRWHAGLDLTNLSTGSMMSITPDFEISKTSGIVTGYIGDRVILHSGNYNSYSPTLTGGGASGTWGINITGNASTATKLQTTRNIWGQSFDGTGNVSGAMTGVSTISASGNITTNGNITSVGYITSQSYITARIASDMRLKDNIQTINNGLSIIRQLRPIEADWNSIAQRLNPHDHKGHLASFIAQEYMNVLPFATKKMSDGYFGIDNTAVIPYLTSAVTEVDDKVTRLEKRVQYLEKELKKYKTA